jgi:hypothetical protein
MFEKVEKYQKMLLYVCLRADSFYIQILYLVTNQIFLPNQNRKFLQKL